MKKNILLFLVLLTVLCQCAKDGTDGLTGPKGAEGDASVLTNVTRTVYTGTLDAFGCAAFLMPEMVSSDMPIVQTHIYYNGFYGAGWYDVGFFNGLTLLTEGLAQIVTSPTYTGCPYRIVVIK